MRALYVDSPFIEVYGVDIVTIQTIEVGAECQEKSRTSQDSTNFNVGLVSRRQLLQPVDDEIIEILLL
jgi:hypothetical protein